MIENHYLVLKHDDISLFLNQAEQDELVRIYKKINMFRIHEDKGPLHGLFINKQWSIYEEVKEILINYIAEETQNAN